MKIYVYTFFCLFLSCGLGRHLVGQSCKDVDQCAWHPCLHSGTCYNLRPGYLCVCAPGHAGDNCQWNSHHSGRHLLTAPTAIAALTVSLLLLGECIYRTVSVVISSLTLAFLYEYLLLLSVITLIRLSTIC